MVKIQPCRNGCKKLITVQFDDGKYKPFEVDTEGNATQLHDCPNSDYNKNKGRQQQEQHQQQSTQVNDSVVRNNNTSIDRPSLESILLNQMNQKLDQMIKQMNETIDTKLNEVLEYCKNNNLMNEAMVAHFGLTQPTSAAELYKKQQQEQQQQQQGPAKVNGWNSVPNSTTSAAEEEEEKEDQELEGKGI